MKKFKLFAAAFLASSLVLSGCNLLMPKKGGKGSSSGTPTDTSGSGSQSGDTVAVTGVSLNKSSLSLKVNASETLTATVNPSNATNKDVTWESSNTSVATVSNGTVKGIAKGSATITVKTSDGNFTATCSVTVSENTPAVTDWTAAQKQVMTEHLNGVVLPFISNGTWNWYWDSDYSCVSGEGASVTVAQAKAVYDSNNAWTYEGYDEQYESYAFSHVIDEQYYVIATIYEMSSSIPCEVDGYLYEFGSQTTDTDWNSTVKEALIATLGEAIPFYPFGSNYTYYQYNDLAIGIFDEYSTDLTAEYVTELKKAGSGYTYQGTDTDTGSEVFSKTKTDGGVITLAVYFDEDYGNCVDAVLTPASTEVSSWSDITPIAEFETHAGISIPSFSSSAYSYYVHNDTLHIEGVASSDLSSAYSTALSGIARLIVNEENGSASDWEEKISFVYYPDGQEDEETGEITTVEKFVLEIKKSEQTSTFTEQWPSSLVSEYIAEFIETSVEVPAIADNTTGYKVRTYVVSYEDAYEYYVEYYEYISELMEELSGEGYTDEEIAEYAAEAAASESGLFVSLVDTNSDLEATYNALFDENVWTKEVQQTTDEETGEVTATYTYWTEEESGLTLCVYVSGGIFYVQVMLYDGGVTPVGDGDILSAETLGIDGKTVYKEYAYAGESGVNYSVQCAGGSNNEVIQIRSKNGTSGIVGGLASLHCVGIVFTFGDQDTLTGKQVDIYASNTAFDIGDMYDSSVECVGSVTVNADEPQTYTFTDNYSFIGIRSNNGALYIQSLEIVWA